MPRAPCSTSGSERRGDVVAMHLIDPPPAVALDHRFAGEEFFQQHRAPRPIHAREPRDDSARREHHVLRFAQNLAGLAIWLRRALLRHPRAVRLRIDRCAAGEDEPPRREHRREIPRAFEIHAAIGVRAAAPGTRAVDHRVEPRNSDRAASAAASAMSTAMAAKGSPASRAADSAECVPPMTSHPRAWKSRAVASPTKPTSGDEDPRHRATAAVRRAPR